MFQSALRMRGLFNLKGLPLGDQRKAMFQSALRMRGLFNNVNSRGRLVALSFNPPCGCVAFSTRIDTDRLEAESIVFQSALRMRGLFNNRWLASQKSPFRVSIRLADAWPFQPYAHMAIRTHVLGFNPPCGCVAFSTPRCVRASWA